MPNRDRWEDDREREDERQMRRRDAREDDRPDDFGQADYSTDYAYDPRTRSGYRTYDEYREYGQADFREDYDYDPRTRTARLNYDPEERRAYERARYGDDSRERRDTRRADYEDRREIARDDRDYDHGREPRSWLDDARDSLAGMFGAGAAEARGPNRREQEAYRRERVIRAVICGRLDHDRELDTSDIHVTIRDSEVTLDGTVRSREEKRRAEDLADVRGVTHVQNNLRVRQDRSWWR